MPPRFAARMAGRRFRDEADLAATAVDLTLAWVLRPPPHGAARLRRARRLHAATSRSAVAAFLAALPPECLCRRLDPNRLWAGLLAMVAVAEALAQNDPALLPLPMTRAWLIGFCLAGLREG